MRPIGESGFTMDIYQNEYLPAGGQDVNAVITVTSGQLAQADATASAEIIIVDCSGSMGSPHTKIAEAQAATAAAVDVIRDGAAFAVIAGNTTARPVFPADGTMAIASPASRQAARTAVAGLRPSGGTAIGQWLRLAHQMFSASPATLRHAILLTDGQNQHESPEQLDASIGLCEGVFSCDCRGVGTDWEVGELRRISAALLGTVDIVPEPGGLAADFEAMMDAAMGKQLGGLSLRVWTPQQATVRFVRQVAPTVQDLTGRRAQAGPQVSDYPAGAWASGESRDYHLGVHVTAAGVGEEMLAARVSLISGGPAAPEILGQVLVRAVWTADEALSTRINTQVAHYMGQAELAQAIQEGLEARRLGDEATATARLGRAVALAEQSGHRDTARLLASVVDVVDAATGTVRLKQRVDDADAMALDTRSTRTVRRAERDIRITEAVPGPGVIGDREHVGPGGLSGPQPPRPERFLVAQLPAQVPLGTEVSLLIRVSTDLMLAQAAKSAPLPGLVVDPGGTPVTVVVQAPYGLIPHTPLEQVISVPPAGDSEPVRFAFQAHEAGPQHVLATAWAGGTFLAELALELSVSDAGPYQDAPARTTPLARMQAEPGEVTLQVRSDGQRYTFQLLSESYLFEPVLAEELTAHPTQAVERTIATLRSMATGRSQYSGGTARTWMEQAGVGLWNDMVPGLIKEQFWQLSGHVGAFSIATGHDVIPWELLYPLAAGHDEGFLVEQFPVMRRVYGQQRSRRFMIGSTRYVVPSGIPTNAREEITAIGRVVDGADRPAETVAGVDVLLRLIESGRCGPLHFACHNTFTTDAGGSAITMSGGPFVPMLLNKAVTLHALAGQHPLVFINACRSAGAVPEYTRMMGWAQQFMAAGAGAFVGTLWAVRSDNAAVFAETFYTALAAGSTLGEAGQRARIEASHDQDDPTWLAYSMYGDPLAKAIAVSTG